MPKDFTFTSGIPARLNVRELLEQVRAVAPKATIEYEPPVNHSRWPYHEGVPKPEHLTEPEDPSAPYQSPATITIRGVPDRYSREQVAAFLQAHAPEKTEEEDWREVQANLLVDRLIEALSLVSRQKRDLLRQVVVGDN